MGARALGGVGRVVTWLHAEEVDDGVHRLLEDRVGEREGLYDLGWGGGEGEGEW